MGIARIKNASSCGNFDRFESSFGSENSISSGAVVVVLNGLSEREKKGGVVEKTKEARKSVR